MPCALFWSNSNELTGFSSAGPSGCKMMEEANEDGALGSRIWALRGKLLSLAEVVGVLLEAATVFKSLPVKMLEVLEEVLKETLGGKLE